MDKEAEALAQEDAARSRKDDEIKYFRGELEFSDPDSPRWFKIRARVALAFRKPVSSMLKRIWHHALRLRQRLLPRPYPGYPDFPSTARNQLVGAIPLLAAVAPGLWKTPTQGGFKRYLTVVG